MRISPFDFAIIFLYLAGITLFGARFRRGQQNLRDYFLGGRTAPWWALACSIVATETSTLTIIGTPAIAFAGDLGFLQLVLGYLVARVILCVVLIPQYFQGEFYTAYQLLEKRFGGRMKLAAASVLLGTRALAEGVRISAIGKVVSVAFGTGDRVSIAIVTALTLFYTFEGGMRAVIWTDVVQFVLYLTGSVTAFFLLLHKIPGGWPAVSHAAAAAGGGRPPEQGGAAPSPAPPQRDHCGFPEPEPADEHHELAGLQAQIDCGQHRRLAVAFLHRLQLQQRVVHRAISLVIRGRAAKRSAAATAAATSSDRPMPASARRASSV